MKKSTPKIRLGVNIDHCATLRQVRGGTTSYPDIVEMAKLAVKGGADLLTIHLREDRRHIQVEDLVRLTKNRPAPINLEMAATPAMLKLALKYKPNWVCYVPEKRAELTTEGGLDVVGQFAKLKAQVQKLQRAGISVSMFIDADPDQIEKSAELGADAVEFHTGSWVLARGAKEKREWDRLQAGARLAHELGLHVHAGHGLDYKTTPKACQMPFLEEVNIGHSLVCYALELGLVESVRRMKKIIGKSQ